MMSDADDTKLRTITHLRKEMDTPRAVYSLIDFCRIDGMQLSISELVARLNAVEADLMEFYTARASRGENVARK